MIRSLQKSFRIAKVLDLNALVAEKEQLEQRLKSWMSEWERLGEELET